MSDRITDSFTQSDVEGGGTVSDDGNRTISGPEDIVHRLRQRVRRHEELRLQGDGGFIPGVELFAEAAAEIERLRAALARCGFLLDAENVAVPADLQTVIDDTDWTGIG